MGVSKKKTHTKTSFNFFVCRILWFFAFAIPCQRSELIYYEINNRSLFFIKKVHIYSSRCPFSSEQVQRARAYYARCTHLNKSAPQYRMCAQCGHIDCSGRPWSWKCSRVHSSYASFARMMQYRLTNALQTPRLHGNCSGERLMSVRFIVFAVIMCGLYWGNDVQRLSLRNSCMIYKSVKYWQLTWNFKNGIVMVAFLC